MTKTNSDKNNYRKRVASFQEWDLFFWKLGFSWGFEWGVPFLMGVWGGVKNSLLE